MVVLPYLFFRSCMQTRRQGFLDYLMHIQVYFVGQELNLWEMSAGLLEENGFAYKMTVCWEFNKAFLPWYKHVNLQSVLSSEMKLK
ncbi:hypothetical protein Dsin_003410 [Dipteronia sinensis]|uniref:Uncharacterized protein n=1 Tax=Dipteronia sinensis TaxID=43782 RepID=A0AAE0B9F8_9ROSI|nr:hypothetical protein Dsin_003410 [Dipteronia sinensis]